MAYSFDLNDLVSRKQKADTALVPAFFAAVVDQARLQAGAVYHCLEGSEDDFQIKPQADVLEIANVKLNPLVIGHIIAPADLPGAGKAGPHCKIYVAARAIHLKFGNRNRPRANNAHVAQNDVPDLRQLIEAGFAKKIADAGDARVVLQLERGLPFVSRGFVGGQQLFKAGFGIWNHRAQLPAPECLAIAANTLVAKKWAGPVAHHRKGAQQDDREYQRVAKDNNANIKKSFAKAAVDPRGTFLLRSVCQRPPARAVTIGGCYRHGDQTAVTHIP